MSGVEQRNDLVPSALGWSDAVPASWRVMPCRAIVEEKTEKNENAVNQNYLSLMANVGIIPYEEKGDVGNKKPEDLSKCKLVMKGDLVINSMNYGIGSYGLSNLDGVCSPVYIVLKPKSDVVHERYALRIFESKSFQKYAQSFGIGILEHRAAIGWDDLKNIKVGIPTLEEQQWLLDYLDRETTRIDALITKKTRFIELLREKRHALITHAVTKGLDPNVKMKESGVEWLGEVPEHWDALPLRRVVTAVKTGGTPSSESPSPDAEGLAWYTPGDFGNSLVLGTSEKRVSSQVVISGEAKVYPAGSVMVVSIGATLGKVGFLAEAASANQQINAVIPNGCVDGYFLAYSLSVKTEAMWFLANAATIGIMNQEKTKEIWVAIPSVAEQMAISAHLDRETSRIDRLVGKTEHSIELLKERRSALITAAVTGQINFQ